jgi:hypothetical protein
MTSIAVTYSRRLFMSLLGSIGTLYASGTLAGNDRSEVIIGTHFPDGFVPAGGPRVSRPSLESTHHGIDLGAVRNAESRPPLIQNRTGSLVTSTERPRIQSETESPR